MQIRLREAWGGRRVLLCGGNEMMRGWLHALFEALGAHAASLPDIGAGLWSIDALGNSLAQEPADA